MAQRRGDPFVATQAERKLDLLVEAGGDDFLVPNAESPRSIIVALAPAARRW
jgi:hypothetical protein